MKKNHINKKYEQWETVNEIASKIKTTNFFSNINHERLIDLAHDDEWLFEWKSDTNGRCIRSNAVGLWL